MGIPDLANSISGLNRVIIVVVWGIRPPDDKSEHSSNAGNPKLSGEHFRHSGLVLLAGHFQDSFLGTFQSHQNSC